MNYAAKEINRIIELVNDTFHGATAGWTEDNLFYYWNDEGYQGYVPYYFADASGTNKFGDHSLHRLLAMDPPVTAVTDFLEQAKRHRVLMTQTGSNIYSQPEYPYTTLQVDPPLIHQRNIMGVTSLHVAVARNGTQANDVVTALIQAHDESRRGNEADVQALAEMAMPCGTTPLHVLCGMNATVPMEVLRTLLDAAPTTACADDICGDNPLTLLWKHALQFEWAKRLEMGKKGASEARADGNRGYNSDQYWQCSLTVMKVALIGDGADRNLRLHDYVSFPRCPSLFLKMALNLTLTRLELFQQDENQRLPLHLAAIVPAYTTKYLPPRVKQNLEASAYRLRSILEILIEEYADAVRVEDVDGRLPLHYALIGHKDWGSGVQALFEAYPESVVVKDPVTGLYPFMLGGMTDGEVEEATKRSTGVISIASAGADVDRVTTTYMLLQQCPQVLIYHSDISDWGRRKPARIK